MVGNAESALFYRVVGENIKKYREAKNYSLEELGERMGIKSKKTIQRYETGEIKIDMHRVADIADALGISRSRLLEGTEAFLGIDPDAFDMIKIPVLGYVPAGGPVYVEENLEGYMPMHRSFVKGEQDFMLKIRGDSVV